MHHMTSVLKSVQTSPTFFGCNPREPFISCVKQLRVSCKIHIHGKMYCDGRGFVLSTAATIKGDTLLFFYSQHLFQNEGFLLLLEPPQPPKQAELTRWSLTAHCFKEKKCLFRTQDPN